MTPSERMEFKNYKVFETELAGRTLKVETGKMAGLANGAALVTYGETAVLATATASAKPREGIDFLPLSVDFDEKLVELLHLDCDDVHFNHRGNADDVHIKKGKV